MTSPAIQTGTMPTGITRTRRGTKNPYVDALNDNVAQTETDPKASKYAGPFDDMKPLDGTKQTEYARQRGLLYSARRFVNVQINTVREPHDNGSATLHFQVKRAADGSLVPFADENITNGQSEPVDAGGRRGRHR